MRLKRLGVFCLPGRGHLYPAMALGQEMKARGYEISVFNRRITRSIVTSAGLHFEPLEDGAVAIPGNILEGKPGEMGPRTIKVMFQQAFIVFDQARELILRNAIQALLVDQADVAAGTVAEAMGIPFITLCFFPPALFDDESPPFVSSWRPTGKASDKVRNRRGNALLARHLKPVIDLANIERARLGLSPVRDIQDCVSKLAVITQLPRILDFPRVSAPSHLFYTGLFDTGERRARLTFPWNRLNGKPIVYATMGTVRNTKQSIFEIIAAASAGLDVQLVISLGGMNLVPEQFIALQGDPIVVHYGPQLEILKRASLTICHAGLNTALESISNGVPLIAIPVTDDQPGVAARIEWSGVGLALPLRKLSVATLKLYIEKVLSDASYRHAAQELKRKLAEIEGAKQAANIIESSLLAS